MNISKAKKHPSSVFWVLTLAGFSTRGHYTTSLLAFEELGMQLVEMQRDKAAVYCEKQRLGTEM